MAECQECGAPVQRVFHPVAVHFKGSAFYTTDYGKKKTGAGTDSGGKKDSDGGSKEPAKSDSGSSSSSSSDSGSKSSSGSSSSD